MNFEIKKILVPTDFSETGLLAIDHAVFMARIFKAELFLLHVISNPETTYSASNPAVYAPVSPTTEAVIHKKLTDQATMIHKQHAIKVTTLCSHGKAAAGILEAVEKNKIDLVIMGTHGAHGFSEYFLGSNAHKTVTICPCPVITVQTHAKKPGFTNILLPIDDSIHSRQKVNAAITLAKKYASKIHILGLSMPEDETDSKKFALKIASVEKLVKKAKLPYSTKIVKGRSHALSTLKHAQKIKADLVVVMTGHESRMTGMFMGPFVKQIVNHSRIPVMSIKPEAGHYNFISLAAASLY